MTKTLRHGSQPKSQEVLLAKEMLQIQMLGLRFFVVLVPCI